MFGKQDIIIYHELIGLRAEIVKSSDKSITNLSGKIVLETKNMLTIRTEKGLKDVAKVVAKEIKLFLPNGAVCFIRGPWLIGRPEDRVLRLK